MILSRLGVLCLALIALLGIAEQWLTREGFALWRIAAIAMFCALLYERLRLRVPLIRAVLADAPRLRLGRVENLRLRLDNLSDRELDVEIAPGLPGDIVLNPARTADSTLAGEVTASRLTLAPGEAQNYPVRVQARELGDIPWAQSPARVRGSLGLAHWRTDVSVGSTLTVVPDTSGSAGAAIGETRLGERAKLVGQGLEFHHLRDYSEGDPIQSIDWKATARSRKPISRVFSEEQHLEIMLLIDAGRTASTRVEGVSLYAHYSNLMARFAQYAVASGDHVGLIIAAARPVLVRPPVSGARAITTIRHALSSVRPSAEETDLVAAAIEVDKATRKRALVVLLTDLYGQTGDANLARSIRFLRLRHKPVVVGLLGEDVMAKIDAPAASENDVFHSLAAQEFRTALRRNADGLRRMGASTILSRPAALHKSVLEEYRRLKQQRRV